MAPQTRKSQASSSQEHPQSSTSTAFHVVLPSDLSTDTLTALFGPTDWATPSPEHIVALYQLVIQQKQRLDGCEDRLAQKDAEVEQALHDQESLRAEATEQMENLRTEIETMRSNNEALEKDRTSLQTQLASLSANTSLSNVEVEQLKSQVGEREREKKSLTDALDAALQRETRLHSKCLIYALQILSC